MTGGAGLPRLSQAGVQHGRHLHRLQRLRAPPATPRSPRSTRRRPSRARSRCTSRNPEPEFRAMAPAQMHGDTTGGIEWFMSTDGNDISGDTMRVTEMTNYFSTSPTFTYTSIPVAPYQAPVEAVQPGGTWTTFPNTTTYRGPVPQRHAGDRHGIRHRRRWVLLSQGPLLRGQRLQRHADPGPAGRDRPRSGRVGPDAVGGRSTARATWASPGWRRRRTEFVSMWVGALDTIGPLQLLRRGPGQHFLRGQLPDRRLQHHGGRPDRRHTFWAANEYAGPGADSTDIWNTQVISFSLPPAVDNDWYSIERRRPAIAVPADVHPVRSGRPVPQHGLAGDRGLRHLRQPGRHGHQARRRPQRGLCRSTPR